jgi:hypothetical protein
MTEDQIERAVERQMNALDRAFMGGDMDREAYDAEVKALDDWAEDQYASRTEGA